MGGESVVVGMGGRGCRCWYGGEGVGVGRGERV